MTMTTFDNLISTIKSTFESEMKVRLASALKRISEKFNIDIEELASEFDIGDDCFDMTKQVKNPLEKKDNGICQHILVRKGTQCGVKVKSGGDYCSKHKKYAEPPLGEKKEKIAKQPKILKSTRGKKFSDKLQKSEEKESEDEKESEEEKKDICSHINSRGVNKGKVCGEKTKKGEDRCRSHKNKKNVAVKAHPLKDKSTNPGLVKRKPKFTHNKDLNVYVHLPTNLVIKSPEDHTVVGRISNNKIVCLQEVDIEVCQENNFSYDTDYDLNNFICNEQPQVEDEDIEKILDELEEEELEDE